MKYPFRYKGKSLVIEANVSGPDKREHKLNFIVDTGAEMTVIDERIAEKLGFDLIRIKPTSGFQSATTVGKARVVNVVRMVLLGRKEKNFPVHVLPMPANDKSVVGLVGVDFLQCLHRMKIDFDAQIIEA